MVTAKDRVAWAQARRYQRFTPALLILVAVTMSVLSALRFWLVWRGWAVLTPSEHQRLLGEFSHPDWTSNRRGIETLVRDNFLSGVRNLSFAVVVLVTFFVQRLNFAYRSRLWSRIEALEANAVPSDPAAG